MKHTIQTMGLLAGMLALSAGAGIVTDMKSSSAGQSVTVSATDLINDGQYRSAVSYTQTWEPAAPWANITDGTMTTALQDKGTDTAFEYTLDTTTNPLGYTITSFSLVSWGYNPTTTNQRYTIKVQQLNSTGWITLVNDGNYVVETGQLQTITHDNSGASLATGIAKISLYLKGPDSSGYNSAIAEFDVFGAPVVPEPAMLGLLAIGGVVLLRRRRT